MSKKTIFELEQERLEWSLKTFPNGTAISAMKKCQEETREVIHDIENGFRDPVEYADVLMCLFDSAGRQAKPISVQEIFDAFEKKLAINKERTWKQNSDRTYSHIPE